MSRDYPNRAHDVAGVKPRQTSIVSGSSGCFEPPKHHETLLAVFFRGKPEPWAAPTVTRRKGAFSSPKVKAWQREVQWRLKQEWKHGAPYPGAVALELKFYREPPMSWSKEKKRDALQHRLAPTTKPDLTNYEKALEDALQGIVLVGDQQVVHKTTLKAYDEVPGVWIKVTALAVKSA